MNATAHQAARTLLEALQQLRLDQPLTADDGRYVDTAEARGDFKQAKIIRSLCRERKRSISSDDQRGAAQAQVKIAYLLWRQGDPDQALRSLATASAAFERLGDVREKAVTQGKIADILEARGQLDEALRIRQEEELPVYERLGDVRSKAAVLFKIGHVNLARKAYPEAMDGLAQAYAIVEGLQDAQGLAQVSKVYGQRLCVSGEQARGIAVLEKAAGGLHPAGTVRCGAGDPKDHPRASGR